MSADPAALLAATLAWLNRDQSLAPGGAGDQTTHVPFLCNADEFTSRPATSRRVIAVGGAPNLSWLGPDDLQIPA